MKYSVLFYLKILDCDNSLSLNCENKGMLQVTNYTVYHSISTSVSDDKLK